MAAPPNPRRQFEEYRTLEYLLLGDFRSALEDAEDEPGHTWLIAVMDGLLKELPRKPGVTRLVAAARKASASAPGESSATQESSGRASRGPVTVAPMIVAPVNAAPVERAPANGSKGKSARAKAAIPPSDELESFCAEQDALLDSFRDRRAAAAETQRFLTDRRAFVDQFVEWLRRINDHNRRWSAALDDALRAMEPSA